MWIWKRYETITQPTYLTWKPTDASSAGCTSQITHKTLCLRQISTRNVWHWYLYEHVRGKEIRDWIFFLFIISTLRFYLEISARYISLSTPAQQRWDIKNNKFSSLPDTLSHRSHCEHFALELFFAGEMASESRWHVLWIKRKMASVIKINK